MIDPMSVRLLLLASTLLTGCQAVEDGRSLELRFVQDAERIAATPYGSPPQIAVWLEDPTDGSTRTLLVTKDSGAGTWRGKTESPEALPRWYAVYRREWGREGYPILDAPVPDAVTRPTSVVEAFTWTAELPAGDRWICWIEVNLSGDYNERFVPVDEATGVGDTDSSGQPSLLYRAELPAVTGTSIEPELYGRTIMGTMGEVTSDLEGVTTALDVLRSIELRLVTP